MVWPEDYGWPQDIGAVAVLDGGTLVDADGRLELERLRAEVGGRLHMVPRLRQRLVIPRFGLGWPFWADDERFDIADHVGVCPLEPGVDEGGFLAACERLRRRPLDRTRALWELWLLPGLPNGRVGLLLKMHHAIADGVAGVATFSALLDAVPDPRPPNAPPWTPEPVPSDGELFRDNLARRASAARAVCSRVVHPRDTWAELRRGWPAVREAFGEGRSPRTSLNQRIGSDRRLATVRARLDAVKCVAHAHGGTVNDVLLAAVSAGFRAMLRDRGEQVGHLMLRAMIPVSLHREGVGPPIGNLDGAMVVPLPIGEADDGRRLRWIAAETARRKQKPRPPGGTLFRNTAIQRAFLRHAAHQRFMNAYVANVPGPPMPLYFGGAPVLEAFPLVPILGNISVGVGALSYAGQFNITVVADRDGAPDVDVFVDGIRGSLDTLLASTVMAPS
jgi:WS/DGAT/MGAT family acyltransferase